MVKLYKSKKRKEEKIMGMPTFSGGVHPEYDGKALTMNSPIKDLPISGEMVYPMF